MRLLEPEVVIFPVVIVLVPASIFPTLVKFLELQLILFPPGFKLRLLVLEVVIVPVVIVLDPALILPTLVKFLELQLISFPVGFKLRLLELEVVIVPVVIVLDPALILPTLVKFLLLKDILLSIAVVVMDVVVRDPEREPLIVPVPVPAFIVVHVIAPDPILPTLVKFLPLKDISFPELVMDVVEREPTLVKFLLLKDISFPELVMDVVEREPTLVKFLPLKDISFPELVMDVVERDPEREPLIVPVPALILLLAVLIVVHVIAPDPILPTLVKFLELQLILLPAGLKMRSLVLEVVIFPVVTVLDPALILPTLVKLALLKLILFELLPIEVVLIAPEISPVDFIPPQLISPAPEKVTTTVGVLSGKVVPSTVYSLLATEKVNPPLP
jgi:hypothetical protein